MERRNFLKLLAALPFVGKLVPKETEWVQCYDIYEHGRLTETRIYFDDFGSPDDWVFKPQIGRELDREF